MGASVVKKVWPYAWYMGRMQSHRGDRMGLVAFLLT